MKKRTVPWLLIGIPFFAFAAFHVTGLILSLLGIAVVYGQSVRRHPRARHTGWFTCKGSGERRSWWFPWVFRRCPSPHCNSGRIIRSGSRHFGAPHIKNEDEALVLRKKLAKKNHVWR